MEEINEEGRIVPIEEVMEFYRNSEYYDDYDIKVIFAYYDDHPIVDHGGGYRWQKRIDWQSEEGMDPNTVTLNYINGEMTQEEYMKYNRDIGYSLYGFWEVFVFNDRFDDDQYQKDMAKERTHKIDEILK